MKNGHFYYLKDKYFIDFPDINLMKNKEKINNNMHDRPCFFAFEDKKTKLFWLVPFSSKVSKYEVIFSNKVKKYGECDTIVFGTVLGHEKAFLIQNMCPATMEYIRNEYIDATNNSPVRISGKLEREIVKKAKKVLALQRKGKNVIFPDVIAIEKILISKNK